MCEGSFQLLKTRVRVFDSGDLQFFCHFFIFVSYSWFSKNGSTLRIFILSILLLHVTLIIIYLYEHLC